MHNRSDWALLGGWVATAAAAAVGSLVLLACSCAGMVLIAPALAGDMGIILAFSVSILLAFTVYGAASGWAQGRVVEATRPAWQGRQFADAWCLATASGFSTMGLALGVVLYLSNVLGGWWVYNTALGAGLVTLGLAQWWVVRRVRWSGLWVPLTVIAWECGVQLSQFLFIPAIDEVSASPAVLKPEGLPLLAAYILVASLTASIITGLGMLWLSRRSIHSIIDVH